MPVRPLYVWNKAPALRLLLPFAAGIVLQWYVPLPATAIWVAAVVLFVLLLTFTLLPAGRQFVLKPFYGLLLNLLLVTAGAGAVWRADVRNHPNWFGHHYQPQQMLLVTLQEPVVAKQASYKAVATVQATGMPHTGKRQREK